MKKLLPVVFSGAMAVSFSTLVFAQSTTTAEPEKDRKDNVQIGTGNQSSQISGSGNQASQDSTWSQANAQNRQSGDATASAGASMDDDKRGQKGRHTNKGWHKGWDDPASSGSTKY